MKATGLPSQVNELPDKREARIPIQAKETEDSKANTECIVTQNSISVTSTEVFSDVKVEVLSVSDNQLAESKWSGGFSALVDGNYQTFYHSLTDDEGGTAFPLTWEFEFSGEDRIDYISIMHRLSGSSYHYRGQIGEFNVYYKTANSDYSFVQKFDFGGAGGYQTANLTTPLENATGIKIEILNGDPRSDDYSDGQYICCAEVEFYNTNREEVNEWINQIFTDLSCSELKQGVTKKDIIRMNAIAPYLATNVAIPLFNDTYDAGEKDFRIHSYEPYSDNHLNQALVTRIYSAMDNPTGIEVEAGKDIIVCVDKIPEGQSVSLAIYGDSEDGDGDCPNYGGGGDNEGWDQNTILQAGINNIRINKSGMAYVMNTIPQADPLHPDKTPVSSYSPVKVHILPGCGKLQGYYDPTRHSEERYKELLNKCSYKYFTIKGKKCMFTFHTNQLRNDFPNSILSGINAWDDIVLWQHQLMGIDQYEWFNNHMMGISSTNPKAYMDASHRRVKFHVNTLAKIGSREALIANECGWGPSHEMGHVNQQAINWRSSTESSNNLFSNFCMKNLADKKYYDTIWSRGKTISDLAKDFVDKRQWALMGDGSYQNEDPEIHMRMNWQLWNYYQNAGYKEDFFPRGFARLREYPLPSEMAPSYYGMLEDPGLAQLKYYEACCWAAQEDLTEFFETWGFFRTIDQDYDQYGTVHYRVTNDMINASKARVRDMNLPKKAAPMQYLEDREVVGTTRYSDMGYWETYRDKVEITKTPKATVSGSKITLTDCDQAVAVELRQSSSETGNLLFFSNLATFNLPSSVTLSGNTLWAVQYDGTRKKVTVQ